MRRSIVLRFLVLATLVAGLSARALRAGPWIETARLVRAGGMAGDEFAPTVAIDGDVAVVGTFSGSVFAVVFLHSGGSWVQAAELVPSDGPFAEGLAHSVGISGDTIVVGAPDATVGDLAMEGKAYVFVRPSGGWAGTLSESAQLGNFSLADSTGPDSFGISVSISGTTIVAGGHTSLGNGGLAFVFTMPDAGWSGAISPSAILYPPGGGFAGASVGISGDVVVAGAPAANAGDGEAYVWVKPSSGWSDILEESADLLPTSPFPGGEFGHAVAIDGTTAVVTSPFAQYTNSDNEDTRVAYLFERPSTGWAGTLSETARLVPTAGKLNWPDAFFGQSLSTAGGTVVVGTPGLRVFAFSGNDGGAFIFQKPPSGWSGDVGEQAKILRVDDSARQSLLGQSVSISGSTILLGAPFENVDGNALEGAAHVFEPGLNPTVTASFSPGGVLTYQPSTLSLTVTNPNTTGFIWNLTIGTPTFPANLFIAETPDASTTCGGFFDFGSTAGDDQLLLEGGGVPFPAGGTCTVSASVSSGTSGSYTTAALPVSCDQGCDGVGSGPATLLVRLRLTQIRFLVEGPVRVAPGVPVEFTFQVDPLRESPVAPTGEVVVSDSAGHSCRSDVSVSGEGSCTLTFGAPGNYRVRAEYLGNLSFGSSTSPPKVVQVGGG
ncbi:MAG TPA: Ig-like domain repeat protein [Thermoanaerobaculia bacterium]|nr:Ig-like domain repeat protein [Thermoanaerobaculia bacterium]